MALTATYDPVLSRIRLALTAGLAAATATFARSTDGGITFTTVRGGSSVPLVGATFDASLDDYEFPAGVPLTYRATKFDAGGAAVSGISVSITQDLTQVWLKVPAAPYLNRPVVVADRSAVTRRSRSGLFDVVGRSLPVMVGDVASGIAFTVQLQTDTAAAEGDLDYLFASGEVVFLQLPSTVNYLPGGYFAVGDASREPVNKVSSLRVWTVPLTEVAAPGPAVVGSTYTCAAVLADYATVTAMIAANATIAVLLDRTASPVDVIVG